MRFQIKRTWLLQGLGICFFFFFFFFFFVVFFVVVVVVVFVRIGLSTFQVKKCKITPKCSICLFVCSTVLQQSA